MKKRVLLVDDEPRVRASLKAVLESSYEIIEAADAADGIQLFKRESPDLVLLDVILPGTDGLTALQTMRAEDRTVPVIMLTGTKSVKTAVDAMKMRSLARCPRQRRVGRVQSNVLACVAHAG